MEVQRLPKVTPSLLRAAETMCPRRLAREVESQSGSSSPVNRSRVRDAVLNAARTAHADLATPTAESFTSPVELEPEERAVFEQAARWYLELYGDRAVKTHFHDCDHPTPSPARGLRIGGWVDLTVVDADGGKELRQFELWDGRAPQRDPLELDSCKLAVLRLSRWVGETGLRVSWADLVQGRLVERTLDVREELPALRGWFERRAELVRSRADEEIATPESGSCGTCTHVGGCPAHSGAHFSRPRDDLKPGIITLSPTTLDRWSFCRRAFFLQNLLDLPASDASFSTDHGLLVHSLLRFVHEHGSCRDPRHVEDALGAHGVGSDSLVREEIERHIRRCPADAEALGHEREFARFHRSPLPLFMGTARIDAVWVHNGLLDARDYKTGQRAGDRVVDDPKARLQAWVLAKTAEARGLRLRLSYEQLSPDIEDDPVCLEPEGEDLVAWEEELRQVADAISAEMEFAGVADPSFCGRCRYRSICSHSASPAVPAWPTPPEGA